MAFWTRLFKIFRKDQEGPERKTYGHILDPFIYDAQLLFVHSTNVAAAQYHIDTQTLMIEYKNGAAWLYSPIPPYMAGAFALAGSKGTWVWSNIRVRGPGGDARHRPGIKAVQIK